MTQRSDDHGENNSLDSGSDQAIQQDLNELDKVIAERDALFERLARATADYQNSRKRLEADLEQRAQYANSTLIKGLQLVHDQLLTALKSQNVEVIAPEPGTPFDPAHHQALMQEPSDQYKEPTVTQ